MDTVTKDLPGALDAHPFPPRYWWLKRITGVMVLLLLALLCLRWWWGWEAQRRLDALIVEYRAAGQPVDAEDFIQDSIPDEENAVVALEAATKRITSTSSNGFSIGDVFVTGDPAVTILAAWDDMRELVAANAGPLGCLREARLRRQVDWRFDIAGAAADLSAHLPQYSVHRSLSKFMWGVGLYQHHAGNDAAAIETIRDGIFHGEAVSAQPLLLGPLVGMALVNLQYSLLEEIGFALRVARPDREQGDSNPASRAQVEEMVAELLDEQPWIELVRQSCYGERAYLVEEAKLAQERWLSRAVFQPPQQKQAIGFWKIIGLLDNPCVVLEYARMVRRTTCCSQAMLESSFPKAKLVLQQEENPASRTLLHDWTRDFGWMSSEERYLELHFRALARRRMAAAALAIRLYELDHGRRPESLEQLVPVYLPAVPLDPFSVDERLLVYLPEAEHPRLYTVGPDEEDDGGFYFRDPNGEFNRSYDDIVFFLEGEPRDEEDNTNALTSGQANEDAEDVEDDGGEGEQGKPYQ